MPQQPTATSVLDPASAPEAERGAQQKIATLIQHAEQEITDAGAGARYAGEINDGRLLAAEEARRHAWKTMLAVLTRPDQPSAVPAHGACRCDGAAYFTSEQNQTRHPFLIHPECPIHAKVQS